VNVGEAQVNCTHREARQPGKRAAVAADVVAVVAVAAVAADVLAATDSVIMKFGRPPDP
jgi:hypothetical protein